MDMTGALNYMSNVTGSNGEIYVCQTSNTSCALEDLQCGHQYNMVISGIGQYCNSNVSDTHTFHTAPCVPQNVTAEVDCVTNVAGITWERSLGANNYTALAVGADGEYHTCYSSETSCNISGLSCGQMYLVTISATNGESASKPSLRVDLHTAPCIPVLDPPQIICYNNSVSLSWSRTSGAISYISNVTSPGEESLFCQTEDTSCTIDNLKCGQTYNVTVTAINAQCSGPTLPPAALITAPCQPQNVVTKMNCSDSEALLSWEAAPGALSYLSVLRTHTRQYVVCNSTKIGCVISSLPCGSVYDVIITSANNQCASKPSFPVELYTVPCVPTAVQTIINCESSVVSAMWAETTGAVNYTAIATGPQGKYYCQTSNTSCSFPQLSCGLEFNTTVVAVGNTCVSDISTSTAFNTVPCKARNPTMTFDCSIAFAVIDWEAALGAVSYTAAITAEDGQRSECSSLGLSCTLYTLKCGQIYNLTVETFGSSCSSIASASEKFHTAPCIPQNVTAHVNCLTNEAALTWSKTPGAFNYTALVIGPDGEHACNTTSTSCNITHLSCGLTYYLTVTGYNGQCQGLSSDPTEFITAPCTPVNVLGEIDCDAASVALSWSAMAGIEGFTSYLVGSDGVTRTCNSTGENCTFSGLPCGYEYDGFVYAVNKQCEGPLSRSVKIYSAPCIPLDVKTSVNRIENSVLLTWSMSPGAINYTSSVIGINGDRHNCSTENTSCQVQELTCGKVYTTMVTAYNSMCNSSESTATEFKSVPCSPENLEVHVTSDSVVLSWGEAPGAINYTAEIIGVDGETYTCNSTNTSCVMATLMCGYQYSVLLTANGEELSSKVSHTHQFKTAPCTPQNILIYVDCVANSATVSWNSSLGAENYTSKAVGTNGEYHICNSTATSCGFTNLTCGISYEVTVKAINEASSSNLSLPVSFITAPCIPVLKPLQINCYDNSVLLSWEKTLGAVNFTASITSPAVDTLSCTTEDTGCTISDLKCGRLYSVTVTAINSQCLSPISAPSMLTTVPCQPQNVMAKMNCYNSSTLLSWNEAPGALRYMSILTGFGEEPLVCNSTEPACEIPGLHCGQSYNMTVTAFNNDCRSIPSSETELYTVPCVPTELQAQVKCESNFATVSWTSSMGADNYTAKIIGDNGEEHGCSTVNLSCSFTQLSCGLVYEATVVAVGKMCSSDISPVTTFHTVPCVATDLESQYQCGSEDAMISWGAVSGGIRYTAIATTQDGESSNCSTTDTTCTVGSLQCGQIYTVNVESFGVICNSRAVSPKVIQTEPCVPQNLFAYIDCQLNNAIFNWSSALGSENYTALVVTTDAEVHTCHTTSTSCAIANLPCGHTYNVTITAFNDQCQGQSSNDIQVITAPCAPQQVHAEIDCVTNSLEISWNQMSGVETFISYLTASDVGNWTCNSILENCSFTNLPCGHEFSVTVAADNSQCRGPLSNAVKILTAPCIPTNINTAVDCVSGSALVSWSQSLGALNYTSILIGPQEETYNCSSQETSCWVSDIVCGEKYTVAVQAQNEVCSSMVHSITDLQACSCVPQNISIFNPCTSDAVRLHWTEPIGAVLYKSSVTSSLGEIYTCETTNNSCDFSGLQCGETYSATVTVFNIQQANVSLDVQTFQTAPCIASNISAQLQCGTNMASLLWDPSQGATSYAAFVSAINGWNGVCSSNSTTCDIYALECGQMYSVSLIASNSDCNSMSNATDIYSAPCIPQNVRTEVICGTDITDVSWDRTPGARNYTATVRDYGGNTYLCSTEETTCRIESLECGENYHVIVTAHGEQCDSRSTIVEFRTGPCILYVLEVMPSCTLDFLTLSWVATLGADYYVGTLTDQNGETLTCYTSDQTCDIKGLQCGDTYNVTLTAYNEQCNSGKSLPTLLSTAPCVPTNLSSSVDCDTQSLTVSWEVAPGAAAYSLTAVSGLHETSFITTNTSYEFTDLLCDRVYEVTASSTSDSCNSQGNSSLHVKTIPCPPYILSAYASCENNSGIIHWDSSQNAKSYVAVLEGANPLSCNTSDTTCEIPELECGQNYTATVWAEDGMCKGRASSKMTFKTVPCIPQNVNSTLLCQENALSVSWDASSGATAYFATAVGRQGQTLTVDVQDPTCLLSGLQCGEVYSLTVLALHDECKSAESTGLEITSVPCSPMHVTATMDCNVNGATAIWEPSTGAMAYTVLFSGSDGHDVSCTSTNMSCSVSGLHCGENYRVTVTAFDNTCHGISSNTTIISAVPCNPTNVLATIDCSSADLINVTWAPSKGAMSYVVTAKGDDGHTLSCSTTTSTCDIKDVHCGDIYSISVTAWSIDCSSETVFVDIIETVPCTPDIVEVQIDCLTNEAFVSWKENNTHPTYHTAVATDPHGKELSCSEFITSCSIPGLECGLIYSFQVHSSNRDCSSLNSSAYISKTAPCQPVDVITNVHCENNAGIISWAESRGAIHYMTTLTGNGSTLYCNTTDTTCSFNGLQCGQSYSVNVMAMDDKCVSVLSAISTFPTAPCQPQGFSIDLDCSNQTVSMLWEESNGAQLYHVDVESSIGELNSYTTTSLFFSSEVLSCSKSYGFTVMAIGETCNSSKSVTLYENSAPCVPVDVQYTTTCPTTMVLMTWSASERAIDYHVSASAPGGLESSCNSSSTSCSLSGLDCGLSYKVQVVAVGQKCSSNGSSLVLLDTAPCLPKNLEVHMDCTNNSAILSWEESRGAQHYVGEVVSDQDSVFSCKTEGTTCIVPDLSCGTAYSFSVLAMDMQCNSSFTEPVLSGMVPCPPDEVETSIYHGDVKPQEVEISWNGSHCGTDYMATVQGQIGYDPESSFTLNSYWTSYMDFYIPVPCSSFYNVTVTARNPAGSSSPSTPIIGYTAPCPPQVNPLVENAGTISISWEESPYADEYRVVEMDHFNTICTTPGLACQTSFTSSNFQVIAVNPSGESNPAFVPGYTA
ncbi:uncharacterized protein LOC120945574 isoform X2 [Rana temporaria]|uniref:uncharacterized protein LOC120945574 isoform X2 n=1 Tax=Rana temporaria TaxID=8407 RepID=UPI001AAD545C|nr:uncharacterized protein LOC120945574 isoform X2 [Rana temporaria]